MSGAPGVRREQLGRAAPFAAVGVVLLFGFVAVYGLLVLTEPGQRLENLALLGAELRSEAERGRSIGALSPVTVAGFALALATAVLVGVVRRRLGIGVLAASVMVFAVVATEVLKEVLPRPALVDGPRWLLRNSFPSGSAAVAISVAVGALLVSPDRLRWVALVAGAIGAAVIAQATLVAGWHRLSDVVGSALLAVSIGAFGVAVLAAAGFAGPSTVGRVHPRLYRALLVGASVVLAIGALTIVLLLLFPLLSSPEGGRRVFLQTAFPLFAAGIAALAVTLFARLIEPHSLGKRLPPAVEPEPDSESPPPTEIEDAPP